MRADDVLVALLRFINERHGTAFTPAGRYRAGEQGAFAITEEDGTSAGRFVLKWRDGLAIPDNLRQAVAVTARLRVAGYPVPWYRLIGVSPPLGLVYSVQNELPGTPLGTRLDRSLVDQLLALNARQRGQALTPAADWPRPLVRSVLSGGDGFCLLDPLRTYSARTATLLGTLQRLPMAELDKHAPTNDIVHFDFQGSNILVHDGVVSGVVDWEGCRAGDSMFDLATLFFYTAAERENRDQSDRLWRLLVAQKGPGLLGVYLAHLILRQVDWSIRFHDRTAVAQWLGHADNILRRLAALGGGRAA